MCRYSASGRIVVGGGLDRHCCGGPRIEFSATARTCSSACHLSMLVLGDYTKDLVLSWWERFESYSFRDTMNCSFARPKELGKLLRKGRLMIYGFVVGAMSL